MLHVRREREREREYEGNVMYILLYMCIMNICQPCPLFKMHSNEMKYFSHKHCIHMHLNKSLRLCMLHVTTLIVVVAA